ncbi:hypothetical protein DsansV1_C16g0142931 [Dioscorea sansibarensis]
MIYAQNADRPTIRENEVDTMFGLHNLRPHHDLQMLPMSLFYSSVSSSPFLEDALPKENKTS